MKHLIRCIMLAAVLFLLLTVPAWATDSDGYIFRLSEQTVLFSDDPAALPDGVEPVCAQQGLFRTRDADLLSELEDAGLLEYAEPDWIVTLLDVPDDPGYTTGRQWELTALHMEYAWDRKITGAGVRIGIIDSGVNAAHEDLAGANILPGTNYTAAEGTSARSNVSDTVGHGTFVTGILAAVPGNGKGAVGLVPGAEIVPLKCFTTNTGKMSDVVSAIYDGIDSYHCQVLNLSLGMDMSAMGSTLSKSLQNAVDYAEAQGVILVAATGNTKAGASSTGNDPILAPAGYDTVIGVGSVNSSKTISYFSYQNASVFLTAPGQGLYSLSYSSTSGYKTGSGTSYAAPMVTAAAALALSVNPDMTPAQFRQLLQNTVEDLGDPGWDSVYGYGFLNIGALLETMEKEQYQSLRMDGLTPGDTVTVVQSVRSATGKQTKLRLIRLIVPQDGQLWLSLALLSGEERQTCRVMVVDDAFVPLRESETFPS